ncbi:MAG TPA: hypothetical protein VJU02_01155, partial [Nitrospiraceae bacterium]|nr:hypothetical protein [Nitrospiraceae bacterium]
MSTPKAVGLVSCGVLLCLVLSSAALAADGMKAAPPERQGGQAGVRGELDKLKGGNVIQGEVLRIDGEHYLVRAQNGKEVRIHVNEATEKTGPIAQGDRIEA